jgi:hypothetical protein
LALVSMRHSSIRSRQFDGLGPAGCEKTAPEGGKRMADFIQLEAWDASDPTGSGILDPIQETFEFCSMMKAVARRRRSPARPDRRLPSRAPSGISGISDSRMKIGVHGDDDIVVPTGKSPWRGRWPTCRRRRALRRRPSREDGTHGGRRLALWRDRAVVERRAMTRLSGCGKIGQADEKDAERAVGGLVVRLRGPSMVRFITAARPKVMKPV